MPNELCRFRRHIFLVLPHFFFIYAHVKKIESIGMAGTNGTSIIIGKGTFGKVYRHKRSDGLVVARKVFKCPLENGVEKSSLREITAHRNISDQHVCQAVKFNVGTDDIKQKFITHLDMKLYDFDLLTFMENYETGVLPHAIIHNILKDVTAGMIALWSKYFLHRDIKCSNIFVRCKKTRFYACLGDLGSSKRMFGHGGREVDSPCVTTYIFSGQEVLRSALSSRFEHRPLYSVAAEMFSLGCVLWYLAYGKNLFRDGTVEHILTQQVSFAKMAGRKDNLDRECIKCILQLLNENGIKSVDPLAWRFPTHHPQLMHEYWDLFVSMTRLCPSNRITLSGMNRALDGILSRCSNEYKVSLEEQRFIVMRKEDAYYPIWRRKKIPMDL